MAVEDKIAKRLLADYITDLTQAQFVASFQALTAQQKTQLVTVIRTGNTKSIGKAINRMVINYLTGLAKTEATTMIEDDCVTRLDLQRFL